MIPAGCFLRVCIVATTAIAAPAAGDDDAIPESFRKVREARNRVATAIIQWHSDERTGPFAERGTQFHLSRIGGTGVSSVWLGDANGVTARIFGTNEPASNPDQITGYVDWKDPGFPIHLSAQHAAEHIGGQILPPPDLRTLGLTDAFGYADVERALDFEGDRPRANVELSEERLPDGLVRLRRKEKGPGDDGVVFEAQVTVDPKRGWCPVEGRTYWNGALRFESRTELHEVDGIWFPRRVEYFDRDYKNGKEPSHVVEIDSAEINRPEHPRQLTLSDLGVEPGIPINVVDARRQWTGESRYWTGEKLLSAADYRIWLTQKFADAGIDWQPAAEADAIPLNWKVRDALTPWEQYVEQFIEKYSLGSEQRQKAWLIHDECVARAQAYIASKHEVFDRMERAARDLLPPLTDECRRELEWMQAERPKYLRPIGDIFELQLKPRLLKLLPAAQRKQAEADASQSQPASP